MSVSPVALDHATPSGSLVVHRGPPRPAPGTLTQLFFDAITTFSKPAALRFKANGVWQDISHAQLQERVRHTALALQALQLTRGDRVALLSENRPEWAIADYACLTAGLADVPIYPTLPAEQMVHAPDPATLYWPVGHTDAVSLVEPAGQKYPALQLAVQLDTDRPLVAPYSPAAQSTQIAAPCRL